MKVTISKCTPEGIVSAPPSKSMAHRLLICAGLSEGKSIIHGIAPSEDVLATLDCLEALGAEYTYEGDTVTINGIGKPHGAKKPLYCRESGSTLRFFLLLCMSGDGEATLYGSETLLKRPLSVYEDIFASQGLEFSNNGEFITVRGKLRGGDFTVKGNISSQFITGLLFSLPQLDENSKITLIPPVESLSYIKMTLQALKEFGVEAHMPDECTILINGNQHFTAHEATVEGDWSNAAFFSALSYLGADVTVTGLDESSLQGDKIYTEHFRALSEGAPCIDISDCPDLGPVLFAVAAAKNGGTFTGTDRLKIKESDRGSAMAQELRKFGVRVEIGENKITVDPVGFHKPCEALYGHNDHRIVMALSILLTLTGGATDGAEAVKKSMPDFFEKLGQTGAFIQFCDAE